MRNKEGITITSLVVYVILLFSFTTFAVIISNNLNSRLFSERGMAINIEAQNKLQYNLFVSSRKSNKVSVLEDKIAFSNGDVYSYDSIKKVIRKNSTVLIDNIKKFETSNKNSSRGTLITLNVVLNKYLNEYEKEIKIFVEE